jgi:hypothetical protein
MRRGAGKDTTGKKLIPNKMAEIGVGSRCPTPRPTPRPLQSVAQQRAAPSTYQ